MSRGGQGCCQWRACPGTWPEWDKARRGAHRQMYAEVGRISRTPASWPTAFTGEPWGADGGVPTLLMRPKRDYGRPKPVKKSCQAPSFWGTSTTIKDRMPPRLTVWEGIVAAATPHLLLVRPGPKARSGVEAVKEPPHAAPLLPLCGRLPSVPAAPICTGETSCVALDQHRSRPEGQQVRQYIEGGSPRQEHDSSLACRTLP